MGLPEGEKSFWFWKVLEIVMAAVFVGAALVLLFHLFRKLFRLIQQYMSFHYREQELQTGGAFDLREKCEIEKDTQRKSLGLFGVLAPGSGYGGCTRRSWRQPQRIWTPRTEDIWRPIRPKSGRRN